MKLKPLISVVMPVYNSEEYLEEAVESILNQSFRDLEFIIINDGSTDDSSAILDRYKSEDRRIHLYYQENQGIVAALIKGCERAQGKYIARMDSDDIALPNRLQLQVNFLEENPDIAVVGSGIVKIDSHGKVIETFCPPTEDHQIKKVIFYWNPINHPTALIRKSAFKAVNGYRNTFKFSQDYDLWLRMAEQYKLANLSMPLVYYRIHMHNLSVQHVYQQAITAIAVKTVARIRKKTGRDPLEKASRSVKAREHLDITPDMLRKLGVTDRVIQGEIVEAYFLWAEIMLKMEEEESSLGLFHQMLACISLSIFRKQIAKKILHIYVQGYRNQRWLSRNILVLSSALSVNLEFALKLFWQKLRSSFSN